LVFTGNPVRQDLVDVHANRTAALTHFTLDPTKKTVLILGGSLGARRLNQLVEKELDFFASQGLQVYWQCGKLYWEQYQKYNAQGGVQVVAFIDRMDLIYAAADFVISRAGASSVSELCLVGKPTLFIPSPNVAEDHQTKNAQAVVSQEGALLLKESELDTKFETVFGELVADESLQNKLSANIQKLAKPNATAAIVEEIVKLIKHS
jgi:UDP-N-acetylglucosamine--N-acetylmuramyl-(pentapeptide) pyrophosphoryl-undecaprenol N-acetylglucosamine transferase